MLILIIVIIIVATVLLIINILNQKTDDADSTTTTTTQVEITTELETTEPETTEPEESYDDLYYDCLNKIYKEYGQDARYAFYDFNKDGIDELIVSYGKCDLEWMNEVYIINDGKIYSAGTFGKPSSFYIDENDEGIYAIWSKQGCGLIQHITMEEGDNQITVEGTESQDYSSYESNEPLEKNVWANLKHLNTDTQYNDDNSRHSRMYMAAIGFNTKDIELAHGGISFGTFLGHISENISSITPNGFSFGVFSRYKYNIFDVTGLINNGSINKNSYQTELNQSWINAALDASMNIRLSDILLIKPRVYVGYTKVSTDKDLKIYNDTISAKDFEFVNFVPSAEIYTRLDKDFYASISAKYVSIDGNTDKNVYANSTFIGKTSSQNYAELGLNLEYDINPVILTGGIRKQFEGFDGWVGDISIKYTF